MRGPVTSSLPFLALLSSFSLARWFAPDGALCRVRSRAGLRPGILFVRDREVFGWRGGCGRIFLGGAMVDEVVLDEGYGVRRDPVDEERRREAHEEEAEGDGHDAHEVLLLGSGAPDGELLGGHHGEYVGDGEDEVRVCDGEVLEPEQAAVGEALELVELFYRVVERDEDGELDDERQTTAQRVDLPFAVESHHLLLLFLRVVFVLVADLIHVRFELLHPSHALDLPHGQRKEEGSYHGREHDDGEPPWGPPTMEGRQRCAEQVEERIENVSQGFHRAHSF